MDNEVKDLSLNTSQPKEKFRITFTGPKSKFLNEALSQFQLNCQEQEIKPNGVVRLPTRIMRITTRRTPYGQGTNTWDRFQMRTHKWFVDVLCTKDQFKKIAMLRGNEHVHMKVAHF